jgi:hypothetical protein
MQNNIYTITLIKDGKLYKELEVDNRHVSAWYVVNNIRCNNIIDRYLICFGTKIIKYNDKIFDVCGLENVKLELIHI